MLTLFRRQEQRTPLSALLRLVILILFAHVWWTENVVYGNAVSLRALGWFGTSPGLLVDYALPSLPSIFQLFITEDFGGLLSTPTMGFVSVIFGILDVIGPAYGWLIRNGTPNPTLWQVGQALVRGFFVSVIAQHIAWVNLKWLWRYLWEDLMWGGAPPAGSDMEVAPAKPASKKASRLARVTRKAKPQRQTPAAPTAHSQAQANPDDPDDPDDIDQIEEPFWDDEPFTARR